MRSVARPSAAFPSRAHAGLQQAWFCTRSPCRVESVRVESSPRVDLVWAGSRQGDGLVSLSCACFDAPVTVRQTWFDAPLCREERLPDLFYRPFTGCFTGCLPTSNSSGNSSGRKGGFFSSTRRGLRRRVARPRDRVRGMRPNRIATRCKMHHSAALPKAAPPCPYRGNLYRLDLLGQVVIRHG